jgi:phosphate transport system substrate-binding protein
MGAAGDNPMQSTMRALRGGAASLLLTLAAACGGGGNGPVRVDGSSTVFPLSEAAAESFANSGGGRVAVGESGTGGGFRKLCRGETDVQGASRPILEEEMAECAAGNVQYVEIPIAIDGLTVVVNPSNPVSAVTLTELRRIWEPAAEGRVTNWRQVNVSWPNLEMSLYGAGAASGTFDFFTEAVNGSAKVSRTDYTPTEDDNITVQGVIGSPGGLGYFGYAYFDQNREQLKALSIDGVAPTPETIASGAYPLARPLFLYVNAESLSRPAVERFVLHYLGNGAALVRQVGYVPISDTAYATYAERVRSRQTGTAFEGRQAIGVSIEDLLARPLQTSNAQ